MNKHVPFKLGKERYFTKDPNFTVVEHLLRKDYPLHWHEFYEIEYIVSGNATEIINGTEYKVGPGFAVLLTPADLHSYKNVNAEKYLTIHNVKFSPYLLPPELQKALNSISAPLCGTCTAIGPVFSKLLQEYNGQDFAREPFILASITQICILLFRCCQEVHYSPKDPEREMILYIREHFLEPINVDTVASVVHLTPNYFSEFFKKHMGIGFTAYVKKLRLEFAANLLLTTDLTVQQTAQKSGFNSAAHFFNSFKAEYGVPPEQFRKKYNQQSPKED